jgi:hypothetical protein
LISQIDPGEAAFLGLYYADQAVEPGISGQTTREGIMRMRRQWLYFLLCAIFAAGLIGCGDDEEEEAAGLPETYSVSGTATRSVEPDLGGNGVGDIYLTMMETCPSSTGCVEEVISDALIMGADLSGDGAEVVFEMSKRVPNGTYYLSGIMDDAPNTEIPDIYAGVGDLVVFGQAAPACVEVIVADGDVTGVGVDFNFVMPFELPIDPDDPCPEEPEDPDDPPEDDGFTYTISGVVTRPVLFDVLGSVQTDLPAYGADGHGPLSVSLTDVCFSVGGDPGTVFETLMIPDADLSDPSFVVPFAFSPMPNGIYYVNGFIDDNTNATPEDPFPGTGDLVSFGEAGPTCAKVILNGGDVTDVIYELNMLMSFEIPGT